mmetsp:Transcript_11467/g.17349  ORF Transcript_11467/g.17349 Transcript_11467/m.17349 type:complete len:216 (-) Transcript_11467:15-662(-)
MSESSADESYAHSCVVNDWESLLVRPSEETQRDPPVSKESIRSVRKMYKSKLKNVVDPVTIEAEESLTVDSLEIRQKLAQKWSDLKGVSARNIKLLHEQTPQTYSEISSFFSSTLKLLPKSREESKQFTHFLINFAITWTKVLTETINDEVSSMGAYESMTKNMKRRASAIKESIPTSTLDECAMQKINGPLHLPVALDEDSAREHSYGIEDEFM